MPRFKFQLDPVLKHRLHVEDQRRRELAGVIRQQVQMQEELRGMQSTIVASKRDLADGLVGRVDMDRVSHFARYSGQVAMRARQAVARLSVLQREIDAARARLIEATRDRRALELLKERQRQAWQHEQDRREADALDEIGLQKLVRDRAARTA